MNRTPATNAAEYLEATRDENKARELHPRDCGSIDLDTFQAMSADGRRRVWAAATDADRRGMALQIIRKSNHGPDEATIALYLEELDHRFGPSPVERAICGALERLATQEAAAAQAARRAGEKDDARFFQRAANAYVNALRYYKEGIRPEPTEHGYTLPSQRAGEPAHLLTMDGDWVCTCPAGATMHWAKAMVIGVELGYDELGSDEDDGEAEDWRTEAAARAELGRRLCAARSRCAA